jgi:hypothetical protein
LPFVSRIAHQHRAKSVLLPEAYRGNRQFDQARDLYKEFLEVWRDADAEIPEVVTAKKFIGEL